MDNIYESYCKIPGHMDAEEMKDIYSGIIEECEGSDAGELYLDVTRNAVRYAGIRAGWSLMSPSQQAEQDAKRTRFHDSFIASVDILARHLRNSGKTAKWRETLGSDRKRIGDFACYLTFLEALSER